MEYELAKKLRDAGFPQRRGINGNPLICPHGGYGTHEATCVDAVVVPTLSELIEACGEKFRGLILHTNFNRDNSAAPWQAKPNRHKVPKSVRSQRGKTAKEAVAKLWLTI